MDQTRKLKAKTVTGAMIGGGVVSLLLLVIMGFQGRVAVNALVILGTGGVIIGAIYGAIVEASGDNKKIGWIVGGIVCGIPICFLAMLSMVWYAITPWASPQPYPGVEAEMYGGTGSWGHFMNQTYTVTLSLSEVEQYYGKQMSRYCENDWGFYTSSDCTEYSLCREARCEIRRFSLEQNFRVSLYSVSETETVVSQWDAWQD